MRYVVHTYMATGTCLTAVVLNKTETKTKIAGVQAAPAGVPAPARGCATRRGEKRATTEAIHLPRLHDGGPRRLLPRRRGTRPPLFRTALQRLVVRRRRDAHREGDGFCRSPALTRTQSLPKTLPRHSLPAPFLSFYQLAHQHLHNNYILRT